MHYHTSPLLMPLSCNSALTSLPPVLTSPLTPLTSPHPLNVSPHPPGVLKRRVAVVAVTLQPGWPGLAG